MWWGMVAGTGSCLPARSTFLLKKFPIDGGSGIIFYGIVLLDIFLRSKTVHTLFLPDIITTQLLYIYNSKSCSLFYENHTTIQR